MLTQAVFLAGGLGTRLGQLTQHLPKPMLQTAGRPFLEYLIDEAARHGFTDIVILSGYLGNEIERHFDGQARRGAKIRVLREPEPLGTGGALRFALPHLDETFLLANADTFFDINLRALPFPPKGGLSMALRRTAPGARYGSVTFEDGNVLEFNRAEDHRPGPINGGIYLMDREIIDCVPEGKSSLEGETFPRLASKHLIRGTLFDGHFIDIGVPEDLANADREMKAWVTRPAAFLDRDGVLNKDDGYTHRPDQFKWLPGAREAIRLCNDGGYLVFVVTNQAGVARGLYDEQAVHRLHNWMQEDLAPIGAHIDAFEYCPHHPEGSEESYRRDCRRRKPQPGMILDLLKTWPVAADKSFLIGDKNSDLQAAQAARIKAFKYSGGNLETEVLQHIETMGGR